MAESYKVETNTKNVDEFLDTARVRFKAAQDDERLIRDEAAKDLRFVAGDQWDEGVKQRRIAAGRPALTFNRAHTFVQQVANEARQNKTAIKYTPAEDADEDTAEVYEGLARHIHYSSEGQIARETAVEYSAGGSFGYYGYVTDYCNDDTDELDLKIRPFPDPFAVYGVLIPYCYGVEPKHAFVLEEIPKDDYIALYPKSEVSTNWGEFSGNQKYSGWVGTDTIKVAEYWCVEEEQVKGKTGRMVTKKKVKFCKINGCEVLPDSETEWVGSSIPIYAVTGKVMFVDGRPRIASVVRHQRDPQSLINLYKSRIAETLSTAPIQPYMVADGQIPKEYEREWGALNTENRPYLRYKPVPIGNTIAPPPQRQVFEPPIVALSEAAAQEIDDMKATTGIYDASLGNKSNEQTGIAIARRQQQADVTNMHFLDNLTRTDQKAGKDMAEIIPKIYDTPRMIRILGADETPKIVKVNQQLPDGKEYRIGGDGVGKYDIIVTTERSFSTKRMESFDMMSQVIQANPNILPMIGDIMFRNSDMAGSTELAERFKKMLPPNLQDEEDGQQPDPAQLQQMIQEQQQKLQALNAFAQDKEQEIQSYKAGAQVKQMEIQSKERIRQMELAQERWKHQTQLQLQDKKLNTDATLKSAQIESSEATTVFNREVDMAMHNSSLDAQAAAAEASQAAEQM